MSDNNPIGTMLVAAGLLSQDALDSALKEQAATNKSLGRILIDRGLVSEGDLVRVIAQKMGMQYVDLAEYSVDVSAAMTIPSGMARKHRAIPISRENNQLLVAMEDPSNVFAVDDIRTITGCEIRTAFAAPKAIADAIDKYYRLDTGADQLTAEAAAAAEPEEDLANVKAVDEDAPVIKLVNILIEQAIQDRASDIHIEPTERDVLVRYRVDGVLHEAQRMPKTLQQAVASRLKIMSDLNIAERRQPQDGRASVSHAGKKIDLRVATLPTVYGEKIVMRVLDMTTATYELEALGFLPQALERYEKSFRKPYGTILVTGPTGSGKSTTLYATLNAVNDPSKNIITVEDPVEYRLPGINQVQCNPKAGLTFAAALRSFLRCDPDIALVGEIRDHETASAAIELALTGHLVLSTLHTNDAASTPTRLIEMGVEPYLVASAVDCIVAQRLARKLCDRCKEQYEPTDAELRVAGWDVAVQGEPGQIYRAKGCGACKDGYRGRFAVHEVMSISEDIERMIAENAHSADIGKVAIAQGMLTLKQAGLIQVRNGVTTLEEILRVIA